MSIATVHAPSTLPFHAENDYLIVNLLGSQDVEVKSKTRQGTVGGDPYTWDFGDGSPLIVNGYEVVHVYAEPGQKVVTVQVQTITGPKQYSIIFDLPDGQAERDAEVRSLPQESDRAA